MNERGAVTFWAGIAILAVIASSVLAWRLLSQPGEPIEPAPQAEASLPPTSPIASSAPSPEPAFSPSPPAPSPREREEREERERDRYKPTGKLLMADGSAIDGGNGDTTRFTVEVEEGIQEEPARFARDVEKVLFDRRSWQGRFERIDRGSPDFRIILASPELTDELCAPLQTNGIYSCFQSGRVVLNAMRWNRGAESYGDDLRSYRIYMVNHEVGHALGYGHALCPGAGQKAPVMVQQTKGVAPCTPNPWP